MILIFKTRMRFELNKRSVKSSYVIHSYHILYHILNNFHNIFIKIGEKGFGEEPLSHKTMTIINL